MRIPTLRIRTLLFAPAFVLLCVGCGGPGQAGGVTASSAPPPSSPPSSPPPPPPPPPPAPPVGAQDFSTRCSQVGVIKCVGFDSPSDIAGGFGSNSGIFASSAGLKPVLDTTVKASGTSSLMFTIPSQSSADAGSYFTNFSPDLSVQFGENSVFYVQWRQRFNADFLNTFFTNGGGWKQAIVGLGDIAGTGGQIYLSTSCTALETVTQNTFQRSFAQMYNSCTGSASHGAFFPFEEPFSSPQNTSDFKMQNARPYPPGCLFSNHSTANNNCFGYFPDEWMTFQVKISTGPFVNGEWQNSVVTLWIAREGQASQPVFNFTINLTAADPSPGASFASGNGPPAGVPLRFGKVWLLPYDTGKDPTQVHPTGFVWYDELIISRNQIADPP